MNDKVTRQLERCNEQLRDEIRARGCTQVELSVKLGKNKTYVSQVLTYDRRLRVDVLLEILKVLDVDPGKFFANAFREP